MPTWWGRKSSKSKDDDNQLVQSHSPCTTTGVIGENKSFVDVLTPSRVTPPSSPDFSRACSRFDSDSVDKRAHPLPLPSGSSIHNHHDTGSTSISSISSSGSADEQIQLAGGRGQCDSKLSAAPRNPERASPTAGRRPMSSLYNPLSRVNLESPTGRNYDGRSSGFSKWKKGKFLGSCSFGQLFQGFDSEKGIMCAIKEVKVISDNETSKECVKRLNQEINVLRELCHPNIVQYYGSELSEEALSVYLEYVSGGSIYKLLKEYGPFTESVIQNYTRQILAGLAYLHGRKIIHRDIKGANILVDLSGEIKLVGFGMAKHVTDYSTMLSFKGSPYWMAPEVVMNNNGYSVAVDVWSLGCTILEMATSKPPWSQFEGVAAMFKIGNSNDIPDIPHHLSNDAKNFIRLCLQRDPTLRPTASQLLEHPFLRLLQTPSLVNSSIPL